MAGRKRKAAAAPSSSRKGTKTRSDDQSIPQNANGNATLTRRVTRNMTTEAARKAALETTEILENILVHLPPKNIFGVQRVSRRFRDVIASSPSIQIRLFLRSAGKPEQAWTLRNGRASKRIFATATDIQYKRRRYVTPVTLSPFVNLWQDPLSPDWTSPTGETLALNARKTFAADQHESWMDTLICDPPVELWRASIEYGSVSPRGSMAWDAKWERRIWDVTLDPIYTFKACIRAMMWSEKAPYDAWPVHFRSVGGSLALLSQNIKQETGIPLQLGSKSGKGVTIKLRKAVVPTKAELDLSGLRIY